MTDAAEKPVRKERAFLAYPRKKLPLLDAGARIEHFDELHAEVPAAHLREQSARCMDCGVPFCQSDTGCPLDNRIPEFNALVYQGRWREASARLHATNNFPEFTGRVCPAPCEGACVLGHVEDPVTIEDLEMAIADRAFAEGWIVPQPPARESGKSVGVIGSGPAGLAAAQELRRAGHAVTVYERADRIGGLLMYGIPNMKLDKAKVDRRVQQLRDEGVQFVTGCEVGVDVSAEDIRARHDAVLLCVGSTRPRDLNVEGRDAAGIHFAMEYLTESTSALLDRRAPAISAAGKKVVVIGGGDTGTDCIATALRQGCSSLVTFELMDRPPADRGRGNPWPEWPRVFRVDYGHAEAAARFGEDPRAFAVATQRFVTEGGRVVGVEAADVAWDGGMSVVEGSARVVEADLVLLAMGFVGPSQAVLDAFGVVPDVRGNVAAEFGGYGTSVPGVFAAGDCRRGQSLVVWAIAEGRGAAAAVGAWLGRR